ncbi:MAG: Ig-like domain-containing protein, partial [Bacteroidota bacterium]
PNLTRLATVIAQAQENDPARTFELTELLGHAPLTTNLAPQDLPISLTVDAGPGRDNVEFIAQASGDALTGLNKAKGWLEQLEIQGSFVEDLRNQEKKLPIGIRKNIGGVVLTLAIGEIRLEPTQTKVDLVMSVDIPGAPDKLILGATDVGFSFAAGFTGPVTLELLADYGINIARGKSRLVFTKGNPDNGTGTYARVTCAGFEELNVVASLIMSRDWVKPFRGGELMTDAAIQQQVANAGQNGQTVPADLAMTLQKRYRVHWDFDFNLTNESGFYIETGSRDTFAINGYNDFSIYANDVTLDFSDTQNPGDVFPENYNSPYVTNGVALPLWRGVYIGGIQIGLPADWRSGDQPPIVLFGRSIIIDDRGFTGMLGVNNLIPLRDGKVDSWAFSLDTFRLEIMQNQIEAAGMAGLLNVPLLKADSTATNNDGDTLSREDCLSYLAVIHPGNEYQFSVTTNGQYTIPLWKSSLVLLPGCSVDILSTPEDGLTASSTLNGIINVDVSIGANGKFGLKADSIGFQGLTLSTQNGLDSTGTWSFPSGISANLGPFAITFDAINLRKEEATRKCELEFNAIVQVTGEQNALAAGGSFEIQGNYETGDDGRQSYNFERFKVNALTVKMTTPSFGVDVTVALYKDNNIYGNGFYGKGDIWFTAAGGADLRVAAVAQFGTVADAEGDYNYFYLDGLVMVNPGVPIGPVDLLGLGGGLGINMAKSAPPRQDFAADTNAGVADSLQAVQIAMDAGPDALAQYIGYSLSGQKFVPVRGGVYAKLAVVAGLTQLNTVVNINAVLELEINPYNGWSAAIIGNGTFFDEVNYANVPSENGLAGFFEISYVRDENGTRFLAALDFFFGYPPLTGDSGDPTQTMNEQSYPVDLDSYAGGIYLLFDEEGLTFNIGNPTLGLELDIPNVANVSVTAYFHMGNNVSPMPPLPDYVAAFAGGEANFLRNESLFASGRGIAFGARLTLTIDPRLPLFYVTINAAIGFDVNFQQYPGAICLETGEPLGINNWFGAGQAFAFIEGSVGMRFRIPFRGEVDFNIASVALGAVLQAKGPNPIYATGVLGGQFSILNGLIRGRFRMQFSAGTECTLVSAEGGDVMENVQLISFATPTDGEEGVAPDVYPQILTNFTVNDSIEVADAYYRLEPRDITLLGPDGLVSGTVFDSAGDYQVTFVPDNVLLGNSTYTLSAEFELIDLESGNVVNDTTVENTFTTGEGYDYIPTSNIAMMYPFDGMYNVYLDESDEGYIQLVQGQPDLFQEDQRARFRISGGIGSQPTVPVTYNASERRIEFSLPPFLTKDRLYSLQIGTFGSGSTNPGGDNPDGQNGIPGGDGGPNPIFDVYPDISNVTEQNVLYQSYFRTSDFRTFEDKIRDQLGGQTFSGEGLVHELTTGETFDSLEIHGNYLSQPLVKVKARAGGNWYNDYGFRTTLYDVIPEVWDNADIAVTRRIPQEAEQPYESVYFTIDEASRLITEDVWTAGETGINSRADSFYFLAPQEMLNDAKEIRDKLYDKAASRLPFHAQGGLSVVEIYNDPSKWCQYDLDALRDAYCQAGGYTYPCTCEKADIIYCPFATGSFYPSANISMDDDGRAMVTSLNWTEDDIINQAFAFCGSGGSTTTGTDCNWCPTMYEYPVIGLIEPWMKDIIQWTTPSGASMYASGVDHFSGYSYQITFQYFLPGEDTPNSSFSITMEK